MLNGFNKKCSEMYYTSQPESAGELVTMVTRKVVLCDNGSWAYVFSLRCVCVEQMKVDFI